MNIKTIEERKSVRTFDKQHVNLEVLGKIQDYIQKIDNPFQVPIEFRLLDTEEDKLSSPVIIDAEKYIGAKVRMQPDAEAAFGYSFEKIILYVTSLGLGSVWLAATIDRKAFENAMEVSTGEVMPAVSPIGYAADKRSIRESMMRKAMKADDRMGFEELFFEKDFNHPLMETKAGKWEKALRMVQLAPSATNKQPWRVVMDEDKIHFYEQKTKGYAKEETGDIQKVDLGIAMCHFEIAAKELGMDGTFVKNDPCIDTPNNTEYIISFESETK